MRLSHWIVEKRQNARLNRALSKLAVDEVPREVISAWMAFPEMEIGSESRVVASRQLAALRACVVTLLVAVPAVLLYAQKGMAAVADTAARAAHPAPMPILVGQQLAGQMLTALAGIIIGAGVVAAVFAVRWRRAGREFRWRPLLSSVGLMALAMAGVYLSEVSIVVSGATALAFAGIYFGLMFAMISAWVQLQSASRGPKSYLRHLVALVVVALLWLCLYALLSLHQFAGLGTWVWGAGALIGWMLAPVLRRGITT